MYKKLFLLIKENIVLKLNGLSENLSYHCIAHTLDVTKQSERIALGEKITDEEDLFLLKTAALYHDSGFLFTYRNHEVKSCEIFKEDAVAYKFSESNIDIVCNIIMATKLPQSPVTKLEMIICDADLDYLGRDDFFPISDKLRIEFLKYGIIKNNEEWEQQQLNFLNNHHYFTNTSVGNRNGLKQKHLDTIKKELLGS